MTAPDQLRQRVAWALSQILTAGASFTVPGERGSVTGDPHYLGPARYYDLMIEHADGNYRDLIEDVTYHPTMGLYLTYMKNRKSDGVNFPDENYARELMQLYTIGLHQLRIDGRVITDANGSPIPTYDNDDIREYARIFTGLTYAVAPGETPFEQGNDWTAPMIMFQPEHDDQPKTLVDGTSIDLPDGNDEITAALDGLFQHANVAPFICYRLIQRLTRSNPTREYVRRVSMVFEDDGNGVRGNLKAVVKAILLDKSAWLGVRPQTLQNPLRLRTTTRDFGYSRLREPTVRYAAMLRGLEATTDHPAGFMQLTHQYERWNMGPYKAPSVFGFYLYDHQPNGPVSNLVLPNAFPYTDARAPEFQILTPTTLANSFNFPAENIALGQANFVQQLTNFDHTATLNLQTEFAVETVGEPGGVRKLINHCDLLFCQGGLPASFQNQLAVAVAEERAATETSGGGPVSDEEIAQSVLTTVLTSPFCAIEH